MLKTLPWRMIARGCMVGVLAGLLVVAFESSDFQGKICEYNQATKHEDCTTYSLFPFLLIKVLDTLNYYGVAITALATVFIGVFTLTLKLSTDNLWTAAKDQIAAAENAAKMQSRDMQASIAVADKAANAAKASADALKATERGILMEKISSVDFSRAYSAAESYPNSPSMWPITAELSTTITFKNYGKTPITIQEICGNVVIADATPRIKDGVFAIEHKLTEYVISPRSESDAIPFKVSKEISWDKNNKITRGTMHIWLIGSVTFVDVFDVTCHREFVWKYSCRSNALKPYHSYEERTHQSAGLSQPP